MATVLQRLITRHAADSEELAALVAQATARGGIVEWGEGSHRARYASGKEVEDRKSELRRQLEADEGRITALGGSV